MCGTRIKKWLRLLPANIILGLWSLFTVFALLWISLTSLKTNRELFLNVWALPTNLQFQNYIKRLVFAPSRVLFSKQCRGSTFVGGYYPGSIGARFIYPEPCKISREQPVDDGLCSGHRYTLTFVVYSTLRHFDQDKTNQLATGLGHRLCCRPPFLLRCTC